MLLASIYFVAQCCTCPRAEILGLDYVGVIVGILSLLVTVLIGYNIITIFDAKKELAIYNNKLNEYKSKLSELGGKMDKIERKSMNGVKTSFGIDLTTLHSKCYEYIDLILKAHTYKYITSQFDKIINDILIKRI